MSELNRTHEKSCAVALPRERNCATEGQSCATDSATGSQPVGLKALANKVLQRNQARNQSATKPENARNFSSEKVGQKLRGDKTFHGLTLAEVKAEAGADWPEVEADPALLDTFAHAVSVRRMRERGEIPPHYTATTVCAHCGPVPIFEGVPDKVLGCPWCFTRRGGASSSLGLGL